MYLGESRGIGMYRGLVLLGVKHNYYEAHVLPIEFSLTSLVQTSGAPFPESRLGKAHIHSWLSVLQIQRMPCWLFVGILLT